MQKEQVSPVRISKTNHLLVTLRRCRIASRLVPRHIAIYNKLLSNEFLNIILPPKYKYVTIKKQKHLVVNLAVLQHKQS